MPALVPELVNAAIDASVSPGVCYAGRWLLRGVWPCLSWSIGSAAN